VTITFPLPSECYFKNTSIIAMASPFDPLIQLGKHYNEPLLLFSQEKLDDPYLFAIDEAYNDLCGLIISSSCTPVEAASPLIFNVNNLLKSRIKSFEDIGAGLNWRCFVKNIARLLFEKISLLDAQHSSNCIINTESELLNGIAFRESGFFTFWFTSDDIYILKKELKPILSALKTRVLEGQSSRAVLSQNKMPRSIVETLQRMFDRSGILSAVSLGIGASANLSGFALEISVPHATWWVNRFPEGQNKPARTAYFHRDESCLVPKALLYLSDVEDDSGPFSVCPASFKQETSPVVAAASRVFWHPHNLPENTLDKYQVIQFTDNLPKELNVNSHYGFDLPDNTSASDAILNDETIFCGHSGTCVVFDGYNLLHRGGLCRNSPRIALQVMLPLHIPTFNKWMQVLSESAL